MGTCGWLYITHGFHFIGEGMKKYIYIDVFGTAYGTDEITNDMICNAEEMGAQIIRLEDLKIYADGGWYDVPEYIDDEE